MSDDEKKAVVAAAFDRLTKRMLAASSAVSDRTFAAVRTTLSRLHAHIEADPDWIEVIATRKTRAK
jgi:hypothetical protein